MATQLRRVEPTGEDRRTSVEFHLWPGLGNLQGIEGETRVKTRMDGLIFFRNLLDSLVIFSQELAKLPDGDYTILHSTFKKPEEVDAKDGNQVNLIHPA